MMRLGGELRLLAVGDDVARLDSELQSINDRYRALCSMSDRRLSHMMEVPTILSRFYASHETVINCVRQLETELLQKDIQPGPEAELHLQVSVIPKPFLCSCCIIQVAAVICGNSQHLYCIYIIQLYLLGGAHMVSSAHMSLSLLTAKTTSRSVEPFFQGLQL